MSMGAVILVQTWKSWSTEHSNTAREREKGSFGLFDQIVLTQERRDPLCVCLSGIAILEKEINKMNK